MPTAILKSWVIHGRDLINGTASMVEGFIWEDTLDINTDGSYVKVSNIKEVKEREKYFMVTTTECQYFLYREDKGPDVE